MWLQEERISLKRLIIFKFPFSKCGKAQCAQRRIRSVINRSKHDRRHSIVVYYCGIILKRVIYFNNIAVKITSVRIIYAVVVVAVLLAWAILFPRFAEAATLSLSSPLEALMTGDTVDRKSVV